MTKVLPGKGAKLLSEAWMQCALRATAAQGFRFLAVLAGLVGLRVLCYVFAHLGVDGEREVTHWRHNTYHKIEETPSAWELSPEETRKLRKTMWTVSEKIHGANFCILIQEHEIRFAKRKALLELNEDFFGYHIIASRLETKARTLFERVQSQQPDILQVNVFGELFGGYYPHPDVEARPDVQAIQTGVYYSPTIEFCAFDVTTYKAYESSPHFQDMPITHQWLAESDFFYSQSLLVGSLEECLGYSENFESLIPAALGLPPLPQSNWAEGIVIKPMHDLVVLTPKGERRPVLKKKRKEFNEVKDFHQAKKWTAISAQGQQMLPALQQVLDTFVTEQRLANAISKVGRLSSQDQTLRTQVLKEYEEDIWNQLLQEQRECMELLSASERQLLSRYCHQQASDLMDIFLELSVTS
jgi:Rnl2 family RNA ligase